MEHGKVVRISLNGIDLSSHLKDITFPSLEDAAMPGVKRLGPIQISGTWDDGHPKCIVCGGPVVSGPEGTPVLVEESTGQRFGPACTDCVVAVTSPHERHD